MNGVDPETVEIIRAIFLILFCFAMVVPSAIDIIKANRK